MKIQYRELQFDDGKKAQATSARIILESGKPEDLDNLLENFDQLSSNCLEENIIKINDIILQIYKQAKVKQL